MEQAEARVADLETGRGDLESVQNFFAQTAQRLPQIDAILTLDSAGRVRIASDPALHASTDFARITAAAAAAAVPGTIVITPPGPALTRRRSAGLCVVTTRRDDRSDHGHYRRAVIFHRLLEGRCSRATHRRPCF